MALSVPTSPSHSVVSLPQAGSLPWDALGQTTHAEPPHKTQVDKPEQKTDFADRRLLGRTAKISQQTKCLQDYSPTAVALSKDLKLSSRPEVPVQSTSLHPPTSKTFISLLIPSNPDSKNSISKFEFFDRQAIVSNWTSEKCSNREILR